MKQDITVLDAANQPSGPFTLQEVQQKLATGEFKPDQLAYKEGLAAWTPLSEVVAQMAPPTSPAPTPAPDPEPPRSFSTTPAATTPSTFGQLPPSSTATFGSSPSPISSPTTQPGISTTYANPAPTSTIFSTLGGANVSMMPGTFWKRLVAYLLDGLIIIAIVIIPYVIIAVLFQVIAFAIGRDGDGNPNILFFIIMGVMYVLVFALVITAYGAYFGYLESSTEQASYGKRIFNLKVTADDGSKLTFRAAALRGITKYLTISFTCCIGGFMALFTERSKTLHDMICGTVVVEPKP